MNSEEDYEILAPGKKTHIEVVARGSLQLAETNEVYLVLLNNVTRFEGRLVKINVSQPRISIAQVGTNNRSNLEYVLNNFNSKQIESLLNCDLSSMKDNVSSLSDKLSSRIAIPILESNPGLPSYRNLSFILFNPSSIPIVVSHTSFNSQQNACSLGPLTVPE